MEVYHVLKIIILDSYRTSASLQSKSGVIALGSFLIAMNQLGKKLCETDDELKKICQDFSEVAGHEVSAQ